MHIVAVGVVATNTVVDSGIAIVVASVIESVAHTDAIAMGCDEEVVAADVTSNRTSTTTVAVPIATTIGVDAVAHGSSRIWVVLNQATGTC